MELTPFCGYNEISDELKATIPELKGIQTFQMLTGVETIDPDPAYILLNPIQYPTQNIPAKDIIWDMGKKRNVTIALGSSTVGEGGREIPRLDLFMPGLGLSHWRFSGKFSLLEGNPEDEKKWAYLWLSNYLEDNKNRRTKEAPLCRFIDVEKESMELMDEIDLLTKALGYVGSMDEDEAMEIAAALNWPYETRINIVMAGLKSYAKNNPKDFLKMVKDPFTEMKATIKRAFDKEVLTYDVTNGIIRRGDETIVTLGGQDIGYDYITGFANWAKENKNGLNVYESVKAAVNGGKKRKKIEQ